MIQPNCQFIRRKLVWLSASPKADNYAGLYMYMGTDESGRDLFKHFVAREYLEAKR